MTTPIDFAVVDRLLASRHSCRAFLPTEVPRETVDTWLRTAQRAASWCNTQPWRLVITAGDATRRFRAGLLEAVDNDVPAPDFAAPEKYEGASLVRRREAGAQLYASLGIARGDREAAARQRRENFQLFGAPYVAILTTERSLGTYGAVDCGVYLGTLMLAAQALGLGCIAQGAIAYYPTFIRRHFGLGDERLVVCAVSFGFPDCAHPANSYRTHRAPLQDVMTWVD